MTPPSTQTATPTERLAEAVLLLLLAVSLLLFVRLGWSVILFPFPVDYGEGPLLDQALRLSRGVNIYPARLVSGPFTVSNYPPLYALAQTPWIELFGPAFWYGRLLSWASAVASAAWIVLILRSLTGNARAALIGGATFLALPFVGYWSPLFRVDLPALALSLAALVLLVRKPERRASVAAAAVLMTAAIFTRQSYALAAPLTAVVWLARSSRRRALGFAAIVVGLSAAGFWTLEALTGGGFSFHVLRANVNVFSVERLGRLAAEAAGMLPILLLAGGLFVVVGSRTRTPAWRLAAPYLAASLVAAATIGKIGSNVNYWLEACAALSIAVGALVAWSRRRPPLRVALLLLLSLQVALLLGGDRYTRHLWSRIDQRPRLAELARIVDGAGGPVLADEELGLLPLAGRPIELQPFELTQLARSGLWDESPLLSALDRRAFDVILMYGVRSPLHRTRWTPAMLASIERAYEPTATVGPTVVFRPRRDPPAVVPAALEPGS